MTWWYSACYYCVLWHAYGFIFSFCPFLLMAVVDHLCFSQCQLFRKINRIVLLQGLCWVIGMLLFVITVSFSLKSACVLTHTIVKLVILMGKKKRRRIYMLYLGHIQCLRLDFKVACHFWKSAHPKWSKIG